MVNDGRRQATTGFPASSNPDLSLSNIERILIAPSLQADRLHRDNLQLMEEVSLPQTPDTLRRKSRDQLDRVFAADRLEIGGLEPELLEVLELVETEIRIVRAIGDF